MINANTFYIAHLNEAFHPESLEKRPQVVYVGISTNWILHQKSSVTRFGEIHHNFGKIVKVLGNILSVI